MAGQDRQKCAAGRIGELQHQTPAVRLGAPAGDGEAETCAAGAARLPDAIAAEETIEDAPAVHFSDPLAVVGDANLVTAVALQRLQSHATAAGGELQRILDEVEQ